MDHFTHKINVNVNGQPYDLEVKSSDSLLDVLREKLEMTGTKKGCNYGECGACTVLLNGKPVNACLVLAVEADGKEVLTIEGVAKGSQLSPLQKSFVNKGAVQCGYCTPGMVIAGQALLDKNPAPNKEDAKKAISGNFCRCTGYTKIIDAIMDVAEG